MSHEPLNIVLIVADQWRADCLGVEGHPAVSTPHLDALARHGWRFTRAYSSCPSCIAARAGLMTGLSPRRHGYVGYCEGVPWRYPTTLAGTLSAAGYHTRCVGKMHVHPHRNLLGYHHVVLHDGYTHYQRRASEDWSRFDDYLPWLRSKLGDSAADYADTGLGCNGYAVRPWPHDDALHPMAWVTSEAMGFLQRRDPTRPFFLTVSYHRPHPPLDPPRDHLERFRGVPVPEPYIGDWATHSLPVSRGLDSPVPTRSDEIALARRGYYAQIAFLDEQINRLTMALYEQGVLDRTAIVFTSDHGEMLYDHNLVAKTVPFEGSARIPLIVRMPSAEWWSDASPAGSTVDSLVELRDILPTCCELARVAPPEGLDGRSVLPLMRGEVEGWRSELHGEHVAGAEWSNQWLTDGREKYAWFPQTGRELLFDLAEDPLELHDLAPERPRRLADWRARLAEALRGRPEGFVEGDRLVVGRPQAATLPWVGLGEPDPGDGVS